MATWAIRPITPVHWQDKEAYRTFPLASGETFLKGAPAVYTSGANTVEEGGTDPSPILGFFTADAADYSWMDDTFGHVAPAVPIALAEGNVFRGTLEATYDEATHVIGFECGIVLDASGYWTLDAADTSNVLARIVGIEDGVEDGDVNIPVRFVVIEADREVVS